MEDKNCGNCRYYTVQTDPLNLGHKQGQCRANPPQLVMSGNQGACAFPPVEENTWCGRHKSKPESPVPCEFTTSITSSL